MLREGGVRGLYQGHVVTTAREIPGNAAWFATYEWVKKQFIPEGGTRDDVKPTGCLVRMHALMSFSTHCCSTAGGGACRHGVLDGQLPV